jgi:hypothetical protein
MAFAANAQEIRWMSGTVATQFQASRQAAEAAAQATNRAGGARHLVVQFDAPVSPGAREDLARAGLKLLDYVGDNAYFAVAAGNGVDVEALAQVRSLRVATEIQRDWKLHPSLVMDEVMPWAVVGAPGKESSEEDPIVAAYVLFHPDVDLLGDAVALVHDFGARVQSHLESVNGLVIELPADMIKPLADDDRVKYIEPPLPTMSGTNDSNRAVTEANTVQSAPYNLDGTGVTVLVYDGGTARATHQDFSGRLTVRDSSGMHYHPTHVAGTIGGDGTASGGQFRGMAPGVILESYGFEVPGGLSQGFLYTDPGDIEDDYSEAIGLHGADISNNSIGTNTAPNGYPCEWEGNYGVTATVIDTIVRGDASNPLFTTPFRIVWANGNERNSGRCGTTYLTTAPPACGKNHITVGALNSNDDSVTDFTSWGPCDDGRIKPDLAAPGCQSNGDEGVTSVDDSSDTAYLTICGTSMAAPTVTGLSALLMQDYRVQYPGEPDFRNSTLKTLLAHTAYDVANTGPDYQSGYGSVRIQQAIDHMRSGNFLEDTVSQGDVFRAVLVVSPGASDLKVTLAWDDVPGVPNTNPVLVNDLDLHIYSPSGTRYYPWTLDPNNPATPAVRNAEDHINNIEQIVVDNPTAGGWTIEVHGFNVPQGPQPFSLAGSPLLVNCSDQGLIALDRVKYTCDGMATIRVVDCGLNTSDSVIDTINVTIASDTEPGGETVQLTETAAEAAAFLGTISLSTADAGGVLQISAGDTITATYVDADDGMGGTNVTVTDTATVDCTDPIITGVQAVNLEPRSADITFNTSEPAATTVRYGSSCGNLANSANGAIVGTSHSIAITGLTDNTAYYFAVDAVDEAGNAVTDDAGGACYSFSTPDIPNFFTEEFGSGFDLDNLVLTFTPNGTVDEYAACAEPITELPTDPSGGTTLSLSDDDYETVNLSGASVVFYGTNYTTFYPASNGYVTFGTGDDDYSESISEHFAIARIAPLFDDFNPSSGGTVSWKQLADRVAVTWQDVPEYNTTNASTFQVEMFFDGMIRIAYLDVAANDGIAGLSEGQGVDPDFYATDLSAMGVCGPKPPVAAPVSVSTPANRSKSIVLDGSDDGLPDPPAAIAYVVTSLPSKGSLSDPNGGVISAAPYTLAAYGQTLTYEPSTNLYGSDGFMYKVNDGDVAPDGGDSEEVPVSITIVADPPVSQNVTVSMDMDVAETVQLSATDPNADPLDYVITALPLHATLSDPGAGEITSAPYTLVDQGRHVLVTPDGGYAGGDAFTYHASDGIFASNTSTVELFVIAPLPVITTESLPAGVMGEPYGPLQLTKTGGQPDTEWSLITDVVYVENDLGTCGFAEVGVGQGWNADDGSWTYYLPFTFPFYGADFSDIRVWSNGMINFGPHTGSAFVNTTQGLIENRRIAPLWDDLDTGGSGEDIFIDESVAGEVTIRWKAHMRVGGTPVDVATTLRENGEIVFHYGTTNAAVTPTIGLSNGTGSEYTLSQYDASTSLTSVNSVLLRVPDDMPDGMTISADGVLSGVPTAAGMFEPAIRLSDSLDRWDEHTFQLMIKAAPGDYNADGAVDLSDFALLPDCLFGPGVLPAPVETATSVKCLEAFDFDGDSDVDLQDVAAFDQVFDGP